jgi:hypothetical protein
VRDDPIDDFSLWDSFTSEKMNLDMRFTMEQLPDP